MNVYQPPKLEPIPIPTRGLPLLKRVWVWLTQIRRWHTVGDWAIKLPDGKTAIIPDGFNVDGASVPRLFWSVLSPTGVLLIPSLIHDFGYRYDYLWVYSDSGDIVKYKQGSGRRYWDRLFLDIGWQVNGMVYIDYVAYLIIRVFGWSAWNRNRRLNSSDMPPVQSIRQDPYSLARFLPSLKSCYAAYQERRILN